MKRTAKPSETNRSAMDLFDLRYHLINHYRKLSSVSSVVDSNCVRSRRATARGRATSRTRFAARPLDAGSRSLSKSVSSLPSGDHRRRRHDCLTPNEKLPTYRSRSETGRNQKHAELPLTSSTYCLSKNGNVLNSRSRSGTARSETLADEHDYAHFAWLITEDILHNQLFDVERIEHVFRSHVAANRDRLNFHRMQSQIDNLRRVLNLSDANAEPEPEPSSANSDVIESRKICAKSKRKRDVAVSCTIDQISIGVMTSPVPQQRPLPKCDKQVNTSNIPSPARSPQLPSAAVRQAAATSTVQNSSSQTDQPLPQPQPQPIFPGSSVSKSAEYPSYQNRAEKTARLTNGDTFITNWPMMKKYQLTSSAPMRSTIANFDAYSSRKRKSTTTTVTTSSHSRSDSRAFDPLHALSDGETVLTSISSLTISVTEDDDIPCAVSSQSSRSSSDSSVAQQSPPL